jgi:hypothetical protein
MTERVMIYVELLDEGVETCGRCSPFAKAARFIACLKSRTRMRWAFPPGSRVRCEARELSGSMAQVACAVVE